MIVLAPVAHADRAALLAFEQPPEKVTLGDRLSVKVQPDGVLLRAVRPAYSLADLVPQCDLSADEPVDLAAWSNGKPVGREAW